MAMTPEERSKQQLCGAKKKNGETCRAFAGQDTDHKGIGRCKYHGGATPNHRKNAIRVKAQMDMAAANMGQPIDIDPATALRGALRASAGHVQFLATEVNRLESIGDPEAATLITLYNTERDRLAHVAKACLDAGLDEVEVKATEAQTEAFGKAINTALASVKGITNAQRKEFGAALRREFEPLAAA